MSGSTYEYIHHYESMQTKASPDNQRCP